MRLSFLFFPLIALSACTIEQQNGDLRAVPAPIVADQSWKITQQNTLADNSHVCTVSAGQVDVTLRAQNGQSREQVAFSGDLDPGARFKILVNGHYYETMEQRFNASDSHAVIQDFLTADKVYTELRVIDIEGGDKRKERTIDNDFSLQGFGAAFKDCQRFVNK